MKPDIPIGGIEKYKGTGYPEQIAGSAILVADLLGDWREEILTALPGEIRIYSSTINAKDRRVALMKDSVYRAGVAHFSMGYIQSPVTGYYLGDLYPRRSALPVDRCLRKRRQRDYRLNLLEHVCLTKFVTSERRSSAGVGFELMSG